MSSRSRSKKFAARSKKVEDPDYKELGQKRSLLWNGSSGKRVYWRHLLLLLSGWLILINYYERSVVRRAMKKCSWERWEEWPDQARAHRVSLFADPQLMDRYSYPGRPRVVNYVTGLLLDNYHRRNWKFVQYHLQPDTTFFLGDLFDGGRYWDDEEWFDEYRRFNDIFRKRPGSKTVATIPGNHDIGFGNDVIEGSLRRFKTYFGETNSAMDLGNHTFVLVDTISLSDRADPQISAAPKAFLQEFAERSHSLPRILLSHVPLYRDPNQQQCGDKRESKNPFPLQQGDQYQTVIDPDLSQEVLASVQPQVLFSGDDHDYCHITHTYQIDGMSKTAEEITVKSCAMNMGIKRPAIQLLSLYNPDGIPAEQKTYQTEICYLPDPYKALKMYILASVLSAIWLCYIHLFPKSFNRHIAQRLGKNPRSVGSPLPMPVSAHINVVRGQKSLYLVHEDRSFANLLLNTGISLISVLLIFTYYYKII